MHEKARNKKYDKNVRNNRKHEAKIKRIEEK